MEKQVLFFGAEVSYGARNNPSPPLGKCLHKWVLKYLYKKYDELGADWEQERGKDIIRSKIKDYLENSTSEALANTLCKENEIAYFMIGLGEKIKTSIGHSHEKRNPDYSIQKMGTCLQPQV